jgi:hypothetical protein
MRYIIPGKLLPIVAATALLTAMPQPMSVLTGGDGAALAQGQSGGGQGGGNQGGGNQGGGNQGGGNQGGGNQGGGNQGGGNQGGGGQPSHAGGPSHGGEPGSQGRGADQSSINQSQGSGSVAARERVAERYNRALPDQAQSAQTGSRGTGGDHDVGTAMVELDDAATQALLSRGWDTSPVENDGFANHGQRVRTMVHIAQALGYSGHVGALQANFGTPQEIGLLDLQQQVMEAQANDADNLDALLEELEQAIAGVKPGAGPEYDWVLVNLDVDGDGQVTQADLEAALAGETPEDPVDANN